jgi:ABC-2 type transport system ATP-binding protein
MTPSSTAPIALASAPPVLELRDVTKYYGEFKAVDGVSFSLPAGSICGFLGPNGAGKTTTIRIILDILKPTRGSLTVLGRPSALEVRQRIGYLPEEKGLYKKMKAWSVIAYFATLKGLSRKAARQRAWELLERYGLKEFGDKPTDALSKGMGQKVQMLACLAHDPEFVILDEPFSGLDPVNQQVMEELIRDLARRQHTVLFSTHVMQHAERLCDRIVLIARGRKIFDGTIPEAKRIVPRRVRLEAQGDIAPLRALAEVASVRAVERANGEPAKDGAAPWELELRENADPQAVLQACFAQGIRLHSFNQSDPTLHEAFMRLVGGSPSP